MLWKGPCFASIKCFIQIDSLGRDCLAKDAVDVDGLSMVDDLCDDAIKCIYIINVKIESRNLIFSKPNLLSYMLERNKKSHDDHTIRKMKTAVYLGDILNQEVTIDDTIA